MNKIKMTLNLINTCYNLIPCKMLLFLNVLLKSKKNENFLCLRRKVSGNRVLRRIFEPMKHGDTQQQSFAMTKLTICNLCIILLA